MIFARYYPIGKAGGFQIPVFHGICDPRCRGIAVKDDGGTLGALLERSGNPACGGSETLPLWQRFDLERDPFLKLSPVPNDFDLCCASTTGGKSNR